MLVLEPSRRFTIDQIKRHRFMIAEVTEPGVLCDMNAPNGCTSSIVEPNEQILRLMAGLGIDAQKTRESLKVRSNTLSC